MRKILFILFLLFCFGILNVYAGDSTSFDPTQYEVEVIPDVPIGTVAEFHGKRVPFGWLECNGQSTRDYPRLAAMVGSKVPDKRMRPEVQSGEIKMYIIRAK
ncbi:MAG TPA: hypothetical protein DCS48_09390 [Desulfovibrio sp.]|nr:hypothetical protein [Desulfovibrio sp.]